MSTAPPNPGNLLAGIDAGLTASPDESVLFYTVFPANQIGQIKKGQTSPSKFIDLSTLGINGTGAVTFVPTGFTGAGQFKITSYTESKIYTTTITPDGSGTFNIAKPSSFVTLSGGVDTLTYIKGGNPGFAKDTLLVAEYDTSTIAAYDLDPATGDPIVSTRKVFLENAGNPSQAPNNSVLSVVTDPLTGDLLISTWSSLDRVGQSQILKVTGFKTVSPSFLNLGGAADYAAFGLGSGNKFSIDDYKTTIFGNVGLASTGVQDFSKGTITGSYFLDSFVKESGKQEVNIKGGKQQLSLAGAVNTVLNASALAATFKPTQTVGRTITQSTTIIGTAPKETQGLNIINLDSIKLTDRNEFLTLRGGSNEYFLINVKDSIELKNISSGIRLEGGITASNVIFNILSPKGKGLKVSKDATLVGTYLSPYASIEFSSGTLDGAIISPSISLKKGA
ncbi:MAG: choice-of-anchor A family protein, partial [Kovacikia sp.]